MAFWYLETALEEPTQAKQPEATSEKTTRDFFVFSMFKNGLYIESVTVTLTQAQAQAQAQANGKSERATCT